VINDAHHWKIVWAALRVAVDIRDENLAEAVADMVTKREGASAYENRRAYVEAQTKRSRAGRDMALGRAVRDPDDAPPSRPSK
jgi:hypothetical protein